jgi:hypothetical protein
MKYSLSQQVTTYNMKLVVFALSKALVIKQIRKSGALYFMTTEGM